MGMQPDDLDDFERIGWVRSRSLAFALSLPVPSSRPPAPAAVVLLCCRCGMHFHANATHTHARTCTPRDVFSFCSVCASVSLRSFRIFSSSHENCGTLPLTRLRTGGRGGGGCGACLHLLPCLSYLVQTLLVRALLFVQRGFFSTKGISTSWVYRKGDAVRISGLQSEASKRYNERQGFLSTFKFDHATPRWGVKLLPPPRDSPAESAQNPTTHHQDGDKPANVQKPAALKVKKINLTYLPPNSGSAAEEAERRRRCFVRMCVEAPSLVHHHTPLRSRSFVPHSVFLFRILVYVWA